MTKPLVSFGLSILLALLVFVHKAYPIGEISRTGAREVSMGNAAVTLSGPFSVFHNQAALAGFNKINVAVDYQQPFLIGGLTSEALVAILPTSTAVFAVSVEQTGITDYHESRFGFSIGKSLGKRFSAGLQFNYFMVDFPEQGSNRGTYLVEIGLRYETLKNLTFGFHLFNPLSAKIESLSQTTILPVAAEAGIGVLTSSDLLFVVDAAYRKGNPLNIRMGIEYQVSNNFFLRAGISGKPFRHCAGLGYRWRGITTDIAFEHHETLGYTPSFSLGLIF